MSINVEIVDMTLPDLPRGYSIVRVLDGLFPGRLQLVRFDPPAQNGWASYARDTPQSRLSLVHEAWLHYADDRNAQPFDSTSNQMR
jgi:hypothetical protein